MQTVRIGAAPRRFVRVCDLFLTDPGGNLDAEFVLAHAMITHHHDDIRSRCVTSDV